MKRILFFLLALITVTSSFTSAPESIGESKDNWVYNLKKPIIKQTPSITVTATYTYYQGTPWGITIAATSSDQSPNARQYGVNIKFRTDSGGFVYTLYYLWHPGGYTYSGEIVELTWPASYDIISWTSGYIYY